MMWKNGYSEAERNALQFTFPMDYKFHYPELSALFDLPEEDTYKYCMRARIESSHIGELDHSKVKRQGFIRDHWLMFGVGLVIFKYFPFFNYYFGVKARSFVSVSDLALASFWTFGLMCRGQPSHGRPRVWKSRICWMCAPTSLWCSAQIHHPIPSRQAGAPQRLAGVRMQPGVCSAGVCQAWSRFRYAPDLVEFCVIW